MAGSFSPSVARRASRLLLLSMLLALAMQIGWASIMARPSIAGEFGDFADRRGAPGPTTIYVINASADVPKQGWGGHWNMDAFNACVDVLRQHADLVARYYHPQGVNLVVAKASSHPKGWTAVFRSGGSGGYHKFAGKNPMAVAYTGSILHTFSACTVMGEEIAEMLGNPKPGSVCYTVPGGRRIQPEIVDPIWGSGYCPSGYEPECADDVAGGMPGFVLPAWFANRRGVAGLSNDMSYPAGVVTKAWEKTSGGECYPCK